MHGAPEGEQPSLAVVLCHGYGAPGTDLVPLAEAIWEIAPELQARVAFVFPTAPHSLDEMGMLGGRAWWPLDLDRILNRRTLETLLEFRRATPPGLTDSRARIVALVDHLREQFGLATSQIVLGGFSQGAMLATDVALHLPEPPAALAILSGGVICEAEWQRLASVRGPLRVLQSHGRADQILPYSEAEQLRQILESGGSALEFLPFAGGHEIPARVLERFAALLVRRLHH